MPGHGHLPPSARIRFDDATLEAHSAHYPAELREPYKWLGAFVREECHRDLDALTDRCEKLDIEFTKETWSKIIRGKWNRDGSDQPLVHPVTSLKDLLEAITLLQGDSKRRESQGRVPFVKTPTARTIIDWLDLKRMLDRVCRFGILVGETGTQKTATLSWYCREHNHGLCKLIEAPAKPNLGEFTTELAYSYGCRRHAGIGHKITKIIECVNDTKTIMIDNAQRLFDPKRGGHQPAFHFLQKLQEDTNCTVILSITPQGEKALFYGEAQDFFEQFVGRAGGLRGFHRLAAHPTKKDVEAIANAFGVQGLDKSTTRPVTKMVNGEQQTVDVDCTVLEYLIAIAKEPGRVRALFEDLQTAKVAAERARERLTIAHIKHARKEDQ